MITLNLISPVQKEANRFRENYIKSRNTMLVFILAAVISVAVMIFAQNMLQNKLDQITASVENLKKLTEEKEKPMALEQKIKDFNKLLKNLDGVQTEYVSWSEILIKTSSLVPSGIELTSFTMSQENNNFRFAGEAKTRDNLLAFKNNLEKSDVFTDVQSPISNILSKENIRFELTGKLILKPDSSLK